jgi:hypothetical protein
MPHPIGYSACVIDLIGNQPILCQRRTWRVSSYNYTSLTLQCILTQTNEQGCFRPHIISRRHNSLSHIMLRPTPFSLAGECAASCYLLRQYGDNPSYSHIDYRLLCLIRQVPLVSRWWMWLKIMRTAETSVSLRWRHDCIITSESPKCSWTLIQSTCDSYISPLSDIGLVTFVGLE